MEKDPVARRLDGRALALRRLEVAQDERGINRLATRLAEGEFVEACVAVAVARHGRLCDLRRRGVITSRLLLPDLGSVAARARRHHAEVVGSADPTAAAARAAEVRLRHLRDAGQRALFRAGRYR